MGAMLVQTEKIPVRSYQHLHEDKLGDIADIASYVGYGYDILNESYVHFEGVCTSRPILNKEYVSSKLQRIKSQKEQTHSVVGSSMSSFCTAFSSEIQMKSDYPLFSGKITAEFDSTKNTTTNTHYIRSMGTYPNFTESIEVTPDLKDHLAAGFQADINGTMSAEDLFDTYGTHLIVEDVMGARSDFNFTYSSTSTESTTEVKAKADATYKFLSGSASADEKTAAKTFLANSSLTSSLYGGTKIDATTIESLMTNMPKWIESANNEANSTIMAFPNSSSLIPVWTLATDPARQSELKDYYNQEGGNRGSFIKNLPGYIQSIMVLSAKDESVAKSQLYDGYTLVDKDLNKGAKGNYIYLAYNTTNDPSEALTDIRISFDDAKMPSGYTKNTHDLNAGAGGAYIYLWTSSDADHGKPLKSIDVFFGQNADMPSGFAVVNYNQTANAADLNHGAGGEYIYLGVRR